MKIRISNSLKQAHKKLLLLISVHPEIGESIWLARANLGIRTEDLPTTGAIPSKIQKEYNHLLKLKGGFLKFYEIEQKFEKPKKNTGKTLSKILNEDNFEITSEIMKETIEYEEQLMHKAQEIIVRHNLPRAWVGMMKTYIGTGTIHLSTIGELPISLKFPRKTVRDKRLGSLSIFQKVLDGMFLVTREILFP